MSKLKTEGVAEFINDAIKTFENCGLLPSELLDINSALKFDKEELKKEKKKIRIHRNKLQQQNQELIERLKKYTDGHS